MIPPEPLQDAPKLPPRTQPHRVHVPTRNLFILIKGALSGNKNDGEQLRKRVYEIFELGRGEDKTSVCVDYSLIAMA